MWRTAAGEPVTGWSLTRDVLGGLLRDAAIAAIVLGVPFYFWGDALKAWLRTNGIG